MKILILPDDISVDFGNTLDLVVNTITLDKDNNKLSLFIDFDDRIVLSIKKTGIKEYIEVLQNIEERTNSK